MEIVANPSSSAWLQLFFRFRCYKSTLHSQRGVDSGVAVSCLLAPFGWSTRQRLSPAQLWVGTAMYSPPAFLASDWVNNEVWTAKPNSPFDGDYRFVYYGVKGTCWSANVSGCKLWYFVPPGEEKRFMRNGQLLEDIRERSEEWEEAGVFSIEQQAGQIIFVPSNWHHQVHNVEDTVSINHNSMNASNIRLVTRFLHARMHDVKKEIEHLSGIFSEEEMHQNYENMLKGDARLNMADLSRLLELVIDSRLSSGVDCLICPFHEDIFRCRIGSCWPLPCSCLSSTCSACLSFLASYELTVASSLQHLLANGEEMVEEKKAGVKELLERAVSGKQLRRLPCNVSLSQFALLATSLTDALRAPEDASAHLSRSADEELKKRLIEHAEAARAKSVAEIPSWKVNVIVGNASVGKSLHILSELRLAGEGKPVELTLQGLATLRFQLARALKALEQYDVE